MTHSQYQPLFELTRGKIVESIHFGAIAVVDATGNLVASYGDPQTITFLRSSAKPFQGLPLIEHGGRAFFDLTPREIALICASHSGTDEHVAVVKSIQAKAGLTEAELLCGVHYPHHEPTAQALRERNEQPTPNRHNCSGKHTGMLAFARMIDQTSRQPTESLTYIDPMHPVQLEILRTFAEMCLIPVDQVNVGIDGCSAPNFAVPLYNAALGYARLCDPLTGNVTPEDRASACQTITAAMIFNPDMVAGPARFDTRLMEAGQGRFVVKGGAEGYQSVGLMPGTLTPDSPGVGIAIKISDGDLSSRARSAVALEVLRQLGTISEAELGLLDEFGPITPVYNWRKLVVGQARPCFQLNRG
jgi:L-asparaginase II